MADPNGLGAAKGQTEVYKFLIYLVGFQDVADHAATSPMLGKIRALVPEAHIIHHSIYNQNPHPDSQKNNAIQSEISIPSVHRVDTFPGNDNGAMSKSKVQNMMELYDLISPSWIEKEALNLLVCIRQASAQKDTKRCCPVLLAGFGFGGIIVKHAMVIANTTPRFYDVAIRVNSLVFVYTPGPLRQRTKWENDLIDMLNITQKDYHGRLSQIFQSLVDFVFQLTYVFHRFTGKYHITHWVRNTEEDELCTNNSPHYLEKVVTWHESGADDILNYEIEDQYQLEDIRDSFAPHHLLLDQPNGWFGTQTVSDKYFNVLHSFSPSKWIIYDPATIDEYADFNDLKHAYLPLCEEISLEKLHGRSIQVIGPRGYGKSAFVKFICEKIIQESTVVAVQNFISPSKGRVTLYDVFASIIHQIISQRPSLFLAAENMMSDILSQDQWTEEALKCLLSTILHHARNTHFLVVIYDFEEWPNDVQNWWPKFSDLITDSLGSTCTFLMSSYGAVQNFTGIEYPVDLNEHNSLVKRFITAKVKQFFDRGHSLISDRDVLRKNIEEQCLLSAEKFEGSFSMRTYYLTRVFQRLTFHSLTAINESISNVGSSEIDVCRDHLLALSAKPRIIVSWATSVLSWILQSVRPLHPEELAAAAAIELGRSTLSELREAVSMDIGRDLHNHLGGLVVVEQKCARVVNPQMIQDFLSNTHGKSVKGFHLQSSEDLVRLTLKYLTIVIENESGNSLNNSVSQLSRSDVGQEELNPVFGFTDYACRFWVAHFHRIEGSDEKLTDEVIEFLKNSKVANRWFELYLLCHGLKIHTSEKDFISTVPVVEVRGLDATNSPTTCSAQQLASYFGLLSLLPGLISEAENLGNLKIFHVRRGVSEHDIAVLNSRLTKTLAIASLSFDHTQHEVAGRFGSEAPYVYRWSSFHQAARLGDLKAFQTLLHSTADLALVDQDERNALHMAAICGSADTIRFILSETLQSAPDVLNHLDRNNETPLILSTRMGNFQTSKILAESGADVAIRDATNKTAMHFAVLYCPQLLESILMSHKDSLFLPDEEGCTVLHIAAQCGSVESVRIILDAFALEDQVLTDALNERDKRELTPLHYAAKNGHEEIAKLLVEKNQTSIPVDGPKSPEILAAKHGHLRTLRVIDQDKLQFGDQLLIAAVEAGQLLVVHYLLEKGISAEQEIDGRIPICVAAAHGWDEILRILLKFGANINSPDTNRQTPLHHASQNGLCDTVKILLGSGFRERANVDDMDSLRHTPLHLAAKAGYEEVIDWLLRCGADIESQSRSYQTPLHLAVEYPGAVQMLLEHGAFLDTLDILGQTPLHKAIANKYYDSVKILLEKGATINISGREEESPLRNAIQSDDVRMVDIMIPYIGRGSLPQSHAARWSYCTQAIQSSAPKVLEWVLDKFPEVLQEQDEERRTLLHVAVEVGPPEIVGILIDRGLDVNQISDMGTPLHIAVDMDQLKNVKPLIERGGSSLSIDDNNDDGNTPLHIAAEKGNVEAICLLLSAKADINKRGEEDETPLFKAAYAGRATAVQELLKHHANPDLSRSDGWTPLHAAADNAEITLLLIKSNANVNQPKDNLYTPLHLATLWGQKEVVKILLENGADSSIKDWDGRAPFDLTSREDIKELFSQHLEKVDNDATN